MYFHMVVVYVQIARLDVVAWTDGQIETRHLYHAAQAGTIEMYCQILDRPSVLTFYRLQTASHAKF